MSEKTQLNTDATKAVTCDYHNATGVIKHSLKNDMVFHMVMNKSKKALKGLICAVKGLNPDDVKSVNILNPIDYGNYVSKEVILDVKVELNNNEILDVELQVYMDKYWDRRSLLYLCRAFDSIDSNDSYSKLKPTTMITITERSFISDPGEPEFYSHYEFLNIKNHHPYSSLLRINVLYLDQTKLATNEDIENDLVHWAELFKATTWEEIRSIVDGNPTFEEVANRMYSANTIPEEQTYIEAHERFLAQKRGAHDAGVDEGIEIGLAKAQSIIDEKDATIAEKDKRIAEKDKRIAEKDKEIAELKAQLAKQN